MSIAELFTSTTAQDVLEHIVLPSLCIQSLGRLSQVCRASNRLVNASSCWSTLCDDVLATRTYLPPAVLSLRARGHARECLHACFVDASRSSLTLDELCSFEWCAYLLHRTERSPLRFKFAADGLMTRIATVEHSWVDASDAHSKRWAWASQLAGRHPAVLVELSPSEVHLCHICRHSNGGFVLKGARAIFTSWEVSLYGSTHASPAIPSTSPHPAAVQPFSTPPTSPCDEEDLPYRGTKRARLSELQQSPLLKIQ